MMGEGEYTRRGALATVAGVALAGLTGCVSSGENASTTAGSEGETPNVQASFFVIGDFAREVAGNAASVSTVVPIGQHGHGWEPGPDVQREVLTSDAFVYVMAGFQPWADDVIANAESDGADVAVIEAAAGVDLLSTDGDGHDEEGDRHGDAENESEHGHDAHGNGSEHGNESEGGDGHGENDPGHEAGSEEDRGHGRGGIDPHFWLDPRRAKQAVETVRQGLTDADSGTNVEAYRRNAAAYGRRLDGLDRRFAEALANAPQEHVLIAGHDAFSYLGERYGFTVHALTGLAPDDQPTPRDVSDAQSIVDEHGIEYVLAPQLESKRAANQLVAETSARDVLEVTPIPGTADEWEKKGWGYVEIMERVNLPSFERALGAE